MEIYKTTSCKYPGMCGTLACAEMQVVAMPESHGSSVWNASGQCGPRGVQVQGSMITYTGQYNIFKE